MPDYGATDRVRLSAAEQYVRPARARKQATVQIHSGTFEKALVQGGLLKPNRFPIVCDALKSKKFLTQNHLELVDTKAPPSGKSSTVIFTYRLEPISGSDPLAAPEQTSQFLLSRGILQATYKKLGGSDEFHRLQREGFDR